MKIKLLLFVSALLLLNACAQTENPNATKNDTNLSSKEQLKNKQKVKTSLRIPYTYWWESSGPFMGMCGNPYSLVLSGTIKELGKEQKEENFIAQEGLVVIHEKLFNQATRKQNFSEETFIKTNSFYNTGVKLGDKVLLFIYEYEGEYTIPGRKSILKIEDFAGAEIQSIKKYIAAKQNPLAIKEDLKLWKKKGLETELQNIIDCRLAGEEGK